MNAMLHVFWALANSIWQSAVMAGLATLVIRLSQPTATQRHAVWCSVLIASLALPLANAAFPARLAPPGGSYPFVVRHAFARTDDPVRAGAYASPGRPATNNQMTVLGNVLSLAARRRVELLAAASFVGLWALGALAGMAVLAAGLVRLRAIKRSLVRCDLACLAGEMRTIGGRTVVIGYSQTITEPCVIGFVRPAIALPFAIERQLSVDELTLVVRHEAAHVRRYDDVANFVQRFAIAVLWLNPIVHIAARRADLAREIACDDAAAHVASERIELAQCLHTILSARKRQQRLPVAGAVRTRGDIGVRISRLLDSTHRPSGGLGIVMKAASLAMLLTIVPFAYVQAGASAASDDVDVTSSTTGAPAVIPAHGSWTMHFLAPDLVYAKLSAASSNGSWSFGADQRLADFAAVSRDAFRGNGTDVTFSSVRDAGTLQFTGKAANAAGTGRFDYVPNPHFVRQLADRGITGLNEDRQFEFTLAGGSLAAIDALRALGFHGTAQEFLSAAERNVQASTITPLAALGLAPANLTEAIRFRDLDIDAAYASGVKDLGYAPTTAQLIRLREHGLSVDRMKHYRSLLKDASIDNIITLSEGGR